MRRARCTALAQGSSLVEADFLDQGDCGLLMCGNLIDWQSIGWERSDLHQDRIAVRCCKHGIFQFRGGIDPLCRRCDEELEESLRRGRMRRVLCNGRACQIHMSVA